MSLTKCEATSDNSNGGRNVDLEAKFPQAQAQQSVISRLVFSIQSFSKKMKVIKMIVIIHNIW